MIKAEMKIYDLIERLNDKEKDGKLTEKFFSKVKEV